jgi:hypothetical protein
MLLVTGSGPIWKKVVAAAGTGAPELAEAKGKIQNMFSFPIQPISILVPSPSNPNPSLVVNNRLT